MDVYSEIYDVINEFTRKASRDIASNKLVFKYTAGKSTPEVIVSVLLAAQDIEDEVCAVSGEELPTGDHGPLELDDIAGALESGQEVDYANTTWRVLALDRLVGAIDNANGDCLNPTCLSAYIESRLLGYELVELDIAARHSEELRDLLNFIDGLAAAGYEYDDDVKEMEG